MLAFYASLDLFANILSHRLNMRIAFVLVEFPRASETFILNQICGLLDAGHTVQIFTYLLHGDEESHPDVYKYDLLSKVSHLLASQNDGGLLGRIASTFALLSAAIAMKLKFLPHSILQIYLKLMLSDRNIQSSARGEYDIIHAHFGPAGFLALRLRSNNTISGPLVTSLLGYDVTKLPRMFGKRMYQALFELGTCFTCPSNFLVDLVAGLGCKKEKIFRLKLGTRTELFDDQPKKRELHEIFEILTVARLAEKKGLEYSVRAFAELVHHHGVTNTRYTIVGSGPQEAHLKEITRRLNVEHLVAFAGQQLGEELMDYYHRGHVFVLASTTDSDGNMESQAVVLQEAQLMGLPVVSTLHNGIPEGVLDGISGFLVPERDTKNLATRLAQLFHNPNLCTKMGFAGQEFVREEFSLEKTISELEKIYSFARSEFDTETGKDII